MGSLGGSIRNISQTAQEREIIKTAPDVVVYLDGLPYLINEFVTTSTNSPFTLVNFNDQITGFNASYSVDNLVPSASISLSVPNHLKYLYQSPGGNYLLQTMMEVQVYAKGYYLANNGNTLYRRVFKGLVSYISYQDDGKSLEISLQCLGILHFLERMQIDAHPSIMTNSQFDATPMQTVYANLNPYEQILAVFLTSIYTDGFQLPGFNTFTNGQNGAASNESQSPYFDAISSGYIAKWQAISQKIGQDVHIFGITDKEVQNTVTAITDLTIRSGSQGNKSSSLRAVQNVYQGSKNEVDSLADINLDAIRTHQPEMGVASVQLQNGQIVNRLERLRQTIALVFYEGYQDVDGQVIIKPPQYNLDVTNLGQANSNASQKFAQYPSTDINSRNNPFIINLAEIVSENETEDQQAVQATRMVVRGSWDKNFNINSGADKRDAVEYVDIAKLAQFGLREEPVKSINWFSDQDHLGLFGYAVSELVRANRGFRTYSVTIPMRPEIKLGFPCYIPHKDMYGYIKDVTIQYQMAGDAMMTIHMDTLRKRPMFPRPNTNQNSTNGQTATSGVTNATQPNLIYAWTQAPNSSSSPSSNSDSGGPIDSLADPNDKSSVGKDVSINKPTPAATPVTQGSTGSPKPADISNDQIALINYRQSKLGPYFTMKADTKTNNWRIQNDNASTAVVSSTVGGVPQNNATSITGSGAGHFANPVKVDNDYYQSLFDGNIPYTDAHGYEVVAPFPWGRYTDLKTALWEFTQQGYIEASADSNQDPTLPANVNAFIFAGLETPATSGSTSSSDLITALTALQELTLGASNQNSRTVIELSYATSSGTNTTQDDTLLTQPQPDNNQTIDKQLIANTDATEQAKVNVFISGVQNSSVSGTQDAITAKNIPTLTEAGEPLA